jgi:Ca2+-binding RTX toxin-like protein
MTTHRGRLALLIATGVVAGAFQFSPTADAAVDPAIEAQLVVYEINRARRSPANFANEAQITIPEVAPRPPVAISPLLGASADFKANEMAAFSYFAHQSQATGKWPNQLARENGYPLPDWWADDANYIESLNSGSVDPFLVIESFAKSPSHRRHIFGEGTFADFGEIGVGRSSTSNYWAVHTATRDTTALFVTGVVFIDDDGDGRLDLGEGLANVTVEVDGTTVETNAGGGYAIQLERGRHTISASGPGLDGPITAVFEIVDHNVGVDFVSDSAVVYPYELCQGLEPTILGTDGPDVIVGTAGRDVIHGFGGDDLIYGVDGDDVICGDEGTIVPFGEVDRFSGGRDGDHRL